MLLILSFGISRYLRLKRFPVQRGAEYGTQAIAGARETMGATSNAVPSCQQIVGASKSKVRRDGFDIYIYIFDSNTSDMFRCPLVFLKLLENVSG